MTTAQPAVRVLVVDDEALMRSGLEMILGSAPDLQVVASCTGAQALAAACEHRPDVVLLDVRMPDLDGLTVLRLLRDLPEPPHVAMLTTFDADEYLETALSLGAEGFLLKDTAPDTLVRCVRALATGAGFLSPPVLRRLRGNPAPPTAGDPDLTALTDRELQVLGYVGQGLSNSEIGERMFLGSATVKDHVSAVLAKLAVANRVQAAVIAERAGLVGRGQP